MLTPTPVPVSLGPPQILWTDLGVNPGLGCEKPAPNPMRYGRAELPQTDRQTDRQTEGMRGSKICLSILECCYLTLREITLEGAGGKYFILRHVRQHEGGNTVELYLSARWLSGSAWTYG